MQRLFSTFPGSWPGTGILVLRIALAVAPFGGFGDAIAARGSTVFAVFVGLATCLIMGAATPIASPLFGIGLIWFCGETDWPFWLITAGASFGLTTLGPGAWSVDAMWHGRKRVRFEK